MQTKLKVQYEEFDNELKRVKKEFQKMNICCSGMVELVEIKNKNGSFKELGLHVSSGYSGMITVDKAEELVNTIQLGMEVAKDFRYNGYSIIKF